MQKKIHVVEDDEDIRFIIEYALQEAGYQVSVSPGAKDFKKYMKGNFPDLILMDIRLPDGDGLQLCESLRAVANTASIPIILMSAHYPKHEMATQYYANDFLSKPFELKTLLKRIEDHI